MAHDVTVYTRVNCSLCDTAVGLVGRITAETGSTWSAVDVDADPDDRAEYGDRVPVILVDGVEHGYYTVDEERLRRALLV